MRRRSFLKDASMAAAGIAAGGRFELAAQVPAQSGSPAPLIVEPAPLFELSPYLYMQFMEPLGATDGSVEAAWDHLADRWRDDVVAVTRDLAPTMMRWGGIFADFYRWREGVGPRDKRPSMLNLLWGGVESNQVGTAEFVDLCRTVGAEPLICVNFESDGRQQYMKAKGSVRTADAKRSRRVGRLLQRPRQCRSEGSWQRHPARRSLLANRQRNVVRQERLRPRNRGAQDRRVCQGDARGRSGDSADRLGRQRLGRTHGRRRRRTRPVPRVPSHVRSGLTETAGAARRVVPARSGCDLGTADDRVADERREDPRASRESLGGRQIPLALTECHFAIPGRDRGDVLSTWAAGVSYARILNNHQRHGDVLKIATAADFCGTRWQNNAVMIPVPKGNNRAYLQPVARVMQLYRHHIGSHAVKVGWHPGRTRRRRQPARQYRVSPRREHASHHAREGRASGRRTHDPRRTGVRDHRGFDRRAVVPEQRRRDEDGRKAADRRWPLGVPAGLGVGGGTEIADAARRRVPPG